ncbi:hypothetical protein VPH35_090998 [Triticum aestivum]
MLPLSMAPASPAGCTVASSASSQGVVLPVPGPLAPCHLLRWWRPPGAPPGARSPRRQAPCRTPASCDRISRSRLHFLSLARRRPMPFNRSMLHWVVSARLRFESLPRPRPSLGRTSCTTTPGDAPSPTMLTTLQVRLPLPCTTTVARTETGKSEDPKYHDYPRGRWLRQVRLQRVYNYHRRVPLLPLPPRERLLPMTTRECLLPLPSQHEQLLPL